MSSNKPITIKDLSSWWKIAVGVLTTLGTVLGATWHISNGQANTQRDIAEMKPMIQKVTELEKLVPVANHLIVSLNKLSDAAEQAAKDIAVDKDRWRAYEKDRAEVYIRLRALEEK